MKLVQERELHRRFRDQYGLLLVREARSLGVTPAYARRRLAQGDWELAGPGLIRSAAAPRSPEQALLAACLAGGPAAVASHESAAWLWRIGDLPDRHSIILPRGASARRPAATIHRPVDYPERVVVLSRIPCTNPLRTLLDLASVGRLRQLDDALDRALHRRLVTVAAVSSELERRGRRGRPGAGALRVSLTRRGLVGAPHPSVLESRTLRLLGDAGIVPLATEVRHGPHGEYRIDMQLAPLLFMEVDGRAYHDDVEQREEDERRRQRIRRSGAVLLVYTWRAIMLDARAVLWEVRTELEAQRQPGAGAGRASRSPSSPGSPDRLLGA